MSTLTSFFHPPVERVRRWLRAEPSRGATPSHDAPQRGTGGLTPNPGHAPGHRHLGPPPPVPAPRVSPLPPPPQQHHQAWRDTGGRVDRLRRNERHGDERKD